MVTHPESIQSFENQLEASQSGTPGNLRAGTRLAALLALSLGSFPSASVQADEAGCRKLVTALAGNTTDMINRALRWKLTRDEQACVSGRLGHFVRRNMDDCEESTPAMANEIAKASKKHSQDQLREFEKQRKDMTNPRNVMEKLVDEVYHNGTFQDIEGFRIQCKDSKARLKKPSLSKYAIGDYITNNDGMQEWIGRVVATKGKTYEIRVTYAKNGSAWRKGQMVKVVENEARQVTHVSIDATIQGWK